MLSCVVGFHMNLSWTSDVGGGDRCHVATGVVLGAFETWSLLVASGMHNPLIDNLWVCYRLNGCNL